MKKQITFQNADEQEKEIAKNIRGRILTDLYEMDMSHFDNVNTYHFTKNSVMEYISYADDVDFFLDNSKIETREVITSIILTMNRHNNRK
ncbi:hypothetical protein [Staphylococcus sp. HMSC34B12]|uniref:hypothetical protein n=1 Tax=Staphylococcus sp. HMSC34B12 TaxID=1608857 RepID=UPI0008AA5BC1|nr:hypothetical protein [Staphylococcus sp. HMSC34B12]OHR80026.1 hypothetical protein HMPREF3238_01445 [Staphylococcus sp. HMSC34B12]